MVYANPRAITSAYVWEHCFMWLNSLMRQWAVKCGSIGWRTGTHTFGKIDCKDPARVWRWDGGASPKPTVSMPNEYHHEWQTIPFARVKQRVAIGRFKMAIRAIEANRDSTERAPRAPEMMITDRLMQRVADSRLPCRARGWADRNVDLSSFTDRVFFWD
ncbi:hypothetical protein B0H17DRAFT_1148639 [Mycena rosella]|uniref:Uncharacterized protein n=1 Tax=Mycena rosella TaxID=1033263 RepID=A0AAD7C9R9_MYCRO|nr:hypothetical protein B0H17DRAFT_1148639 [Mycena rosella]